MGYKSLHFQTNDKVQVKCPFRFRKISTWVSATRFRSFSRPFPPPSLTPTCDPANTPTPTPTPKRKPPSACSPSEYNPSKPSPIHHTSTRQPDVRSSCNPPLPPRTASQPAKDTSRVSIEHIHRDIQHTHPSIHHHHPCTLTTASNEQPSKLAQHTNPPYLLLAPPNQRSESN